MLRERAFVSSLPLVFWRNAVQKIGYRPCLENLEDRCFLTTVPVTIPLQGEPYLRQLYRDLLHREADGGGLSYWSDRLVNGASRAQVVWEMENCPEYLQETVAQEYSLLLHRSPDGVGAAAYVPYLHSGGTREGLAAVLASSTEYYQTRGASSDAGFLLALFQDTLDRSPDADALNNLGHALQSGISRPALVQAVLRSPEFAEAEAQSTYQTYLHRPADDAGFHAVANAVEQGGTLNAVLVSILASEEYYGQASATP